MDPINLELRVGRLPAASAPVGGELSASEHDANLTALRTAAEQLNAEKLEASAAVTITNTLPSPVGADYVAIWDTTNSRWAYTTKAQLLASTAADIDALELALDGKQPTLVSGSNIKTINGQPITGSGDLAISGGGAGGLPVDVVLPQPGQEAVIFENGVAKRTPIDTLINQAFPQPLGLWDFWHNFRIASTNAAASDVFVGAAVGGGNNTTAITTAGLTGFNSHGVFLRSAATANSGYRYQTSSVVTDYLGAISHKFRAQFMWRTSFTDRIVRLGFLDTTTQADSTDGAYFEILGATCTAKTASLANRTSNATTLTLSLDTAYTFDVELNAAGTSARFRVYSGNNYDTPLLDVTNTANLPSNISSLFGAGIVATVTPATASDIGILYSLGMGTVAGFERAHGIYSTPVVGPSALVAGNWTATAAASSIVLDLTAIPASGTSAVSAIRYRLDGGAPVTLAGTGTGVRNITGLTPAQAYAVQLQLVTAVGESPWSDTKTRAPTSASAPSAFTSGQWTATPGNAQIVVDITALPSNGGSAITALQYTLNGSTWVAFTGTGTGSRTITGLTNGTGYPLQIRAVNAIGDGAASDTKNTTPSAGGGSVSYVGLGTPYSGGSSTTHSVPVPAGMAVGDRLGLVNGAFFETPTSVTASNGQILNADVTQVGSIYSMVITGTVPTSVEVELPVADFYTGQTFAGRGCGNAALAGTRNQELIAEARTALDYSSDAANAFVVIAFARPPSDTVSTATFNAAATPANAINKLAFNAIGLIAGIHSGPTGVNNVPVTWSATDTGGRWISVAYKA
jgi:hypothetical protein